MVRKILKKREKSNQRKFIVKFKKEFDGKKKTDFNTGVGSPDKSLPAKIRRAVDATLQIVLPAVAKDTSKLRAGLTSMLLSQVGDKEATIEFDRDLLAQLVNYGNYHNKDDPEFNPHYHPDYYINPTTPGTRPYSSEEIMKILGQKLQEELK